MAKQIKRWVVSECDGEYHVSAGSDPDVVSWFCGTKAEAEAWVAKKENQRIQAYANRQARNQAMRDLGLTRTRYGWE